MSFTMLNIISSAEKEVVLIWHDLHLCNGNLYKETMHGSCPLLKENKWSKYRLLFLNLCIGMTIIQFSMFLCNSTYTENNII